VPKYDAARTLETFSVGLPDERNLDRLGADLLGAVKETMQPAKRGLWLRPDSSARAGDGTIDDPRG
jgi:hypothetical protein